MPIHVTTEGDVNSKWAKHDGRAYSLLLERMTTIMQKSQIRQS